MKEKSEMDNLFISEFQYTEECIPEYLKRWWRENLIVSYILTALVFLYFLLMLIIRRNLVYLVLEILPVLLLLLIRAKVSRAIKVEKERYQVNYGSTALDLVSGPVTTRLTDIQVSRSQAHTGIFSLHYYLTGTDSQEERIRLEISGDDYTRLSGSNSVTVEYYRHTGRIVRYI